MRRHVLWLFIMFFAIAAWGQGFPHATTGIVERLEGGYPEDGCVFIQVFLTASGDPVAISSQEYDSGTGRWIAVIDNPGAGTELDIIVTDSCWAEEAVFNGLVSGSFSTDFGLLVMDIIPDMRPDFEDLTVDPNPGYIEDDYDFSITYYNGLNNAPVEIWVCIDGLDYDLVQLDPLDDDYTDGAEFGVTLAGATFFRDDFDYWVYTLDAMDSPGWSDTLEFTIQNHPAEIDSAWIGIDPAPARETSILTCEFAGLFDSEDDPVEITYAWYVDGFLVEDWDVNTLHGEYFDKHDEVWCEIELDDGFDISGPFTTGHIFIENTPPTAIGIEIFPDDPFEFEDIAAVVITPAADDDDDGIEYVYSWLLDEIEMTDLSILDNTLTTNGETWTLFVMAYDGEDYGPEAEFEFYVGGPVLSDGYVDPTEAHASAAFNFYVTYTNSRNYPPDGIYVDIDGDMYPMSLIIGEESEDYTEGAEFEASISLGVGTHQFRFYAVDDHGDVAIGMGDYIEGPTVLNETPVIDAVSIHPSPEAMVIDNIYVSVDAWHDNDGDDVYFEYEWYRNDIIVDGLTSQNVSGAYFARDDDVRARIIPFDGYQYGAPVFTEYITMINTPPDAPEVGIDPDVPFSVENIDAEIIEESFDADGDEVTYDYAWFKSGILADDGPTLSSEYTANGESWMLAAIPYDGYEYGEDTGWVAFDIGGPVLSSGYVNPATGHATATFIYYVIYTNSRNYAPAYVDIDIDGDLFAMSPVSGDDDYTDGAQFMYETTLEYGEDHTFRFFAGDDRGNEAIGMGDYMEGPAIGNNPPVIETVSIEPYPEGTVLDNFTAAVVSFYDDDGDDVTFAYVWYRNGEVVEGEINPSIDGDNFVRGDIIWCAITPYDGYDYGAPVATAEVEIINAVPTMDNAYLDVTPFGDPTELSTLTAVVEGAYDADDDVIVLSYAWFVNGEELELGAFIGAIDGENFDRGDTVFAEITASDGEDEFMMATDEVIIMNALPVVTEFGISPPYPFTDDMLVSNLDFEDPDDDDVVVQYLWYRDAELVGYEDRVEAEMTAHYETWVLEVRLLDDWEPGEYTVVFDTVVILNSPPELFGEFIDTVVISGTEYLAIIPVEDIDLDIIYFELLDGPEDMEVDEDGIISWDAPIVEDPESYEVLITITDGDDAIELEFNLWVYPITDELFAPINLEATSNQVGLIPLEWDDPDAFTVLPYLHMSFIRYDVWRAAYPDTGDWELITSRTVNNAVDINVEPWVIYRYKVFAIYGIGVSSPSNIDEAFCAPGEPTSWYSIYTYIDLPVIDGFASEGEWDDAIEYIYAIDDTTDFRLMFKNTGGYLYILFENTTDLVLSPDDMFMFSIDDNLDERWPPYEYSDEGEYRIKATADAPEVTFQGIWGTFPDAIGRDLRTTADGLFGDVSDDAGYVTYEMAIPIGVWAADINIDEFDVWVGARVAVYDVDNFEWDIVLPNGSDPENPEEFGLLYIESGAVPGMLCYEPWAFDVELRQGATTTRILSIENCGMGYLNYTVTEACAIAPVDGRFLDSGAIVAFVDDASLVPQALAILGYAADIYDDPTDFLTAVVGGDYELVIVSTNDASNLAIWNAVLVALDNESKLLIQSPDLDAVAEFSIWNFIGLAIGDDLEDRGCALTWELPEHPFFNVPLLVPPSVERIEGYFDDYGDNLIVNESYTTLATFDLYPYPNNAAIVFNEEREIIINSFMLSDINDTDGDSIIDGVELLVNEIGGLIPCVDVEWLDEYPTAGLLATHEIDDITVTFDAYDLLVGEYYAFLIVHSNDPFYPMVYVPCHLTVTEPEPRILELAVDDETYGCPEEEIVVPIFVNSLETMDITQLGMTVQVEPYVGQPVEVDPVMGDLGTLSFGPGEVTFSVIDDFPMPGDGIVAYVHIELDDDVPVGTRTSIGITDVFYNEEAYVTETTIYPGNLYIVSCIEEWYVDLTFIAFGARPDDVSIGVHPDASDLFDVGLDELNIPSESWLDAYSDVSDLDPDNPELGVDVRSGYDTEIHWYVVTGDSAGKVEWAFSEGVSMSAMGSLLLYCGDDVVDMKTATHYFYNAGYDIEIVYRATGERMFQFHFEPGYSMFSVPLYTDITTINDLFPGNLGCWLFDPDIDTWAGVTDVMPGVGYVILFLEPLDFTIWGVPVEQLNLELVPGWNLIGTVLPDVDFSNPDDDPDGTILGSPGHAWYYDQAIGTYWNVDDLAAGCGYFTAALDYCSLTLPGFGYGKVIPETEPVWMGKINVLDRELEFGMGVEDKIVPVPPIVPGCDRPIAYFSMDEWELSTFVNSDGEWELTLLKDTELEFELPEGIAVEIDGTPIDGNVLLTAGTYKLVANALPVAFALSQNAPNPFNSSTAIKFALPVSKDVSITVFDLSGHLVKTLVSGEFEAGFHSAVWNGTADDGCAVGSGVYLCRMIAGEYSAVRRVMLVK